MIITNNRIVREKYKNAVFVEGTVLDVMNKVSEKLTEGYNLMTVPVSGNLVMLRSPYRSVALEKNCRNSSKIKEKYAAIFSDIYRRDQELKWHIPDETHSDYEFMDAMFLDQVGITE